MVPAASRSQASAGQSKWARMAPSARAGSATRPVTTIWAPARSAPAISCAPRYALALTSGCPASPADNNSRSEAGGSAVSRSSPSTTAMRRGPSPSLAARAWRQRAAPGGLAAPKLPTMAIPAATQRASTGSRKRSSVGSQPASGCWRRCSWASASVRSASVSYISTAGPPSAASVFTTGTAASQRSPEKPAPQPMRRTDGDDSDRVVIGVQCSRRTGHL